MPMNPLRRRRPPLSRAGGLVVGCLLAGAASAGPILRCDIVQGGESQTVSVRPATNPYGFEAVDVRGNFRFKAVVIGAEGRIDYIKLYTYYETAQQPRLMHMASYSAPALPESGRIIPLTGTVRLFAPPLGREMEYACSLMEAAP